MTSIDLLLTFIIIIMNNENNGGEPNQQQPNPIGNMFSTQYNSDEFKREFKEKSRKLWESMPIFVR